MQNAMPVRLESVRVSRFTAQSDQIEKLLFLVLKNKQKLVSFKKRKINLIINHIKIFLSAFVSNTRTFSKIELKLCNCVQTENLMKYLKNKKILSNFQSRLQQLI